MQEISVTVPKVSVVIPVYNTEKYLAECLDSLQKQTLKDIEIICVDDGSTDNSLEVLKEYANRDSRFLILEQKNLYAGAARNVGLKIARGEFVIFLDSDDFFAEDLLEKIYLKGQETEADIVLFGGNKYDVNKNIYIADPSFLKKEFLGKLVTFSRKDIPDNILTLSNPAPWTKLYRRQFIEKERLQFQLFPNSNDVYFTLCALSIADKITYVDEALVTYRIGMQNNTQSRKKNNPLCFLKAYMAVYDELVKRDIYKEVEKSYTNAILGACRYNLDTITDYNARIAIYKEIMSPSFQRMGLLEHSIDYYANKKNYQMMLGVERALEWHNRICGNNNEHNFQVLLDRREKSDYKPLVSVIIPVYNVEPYLEECLKSIVNQTLAQIEIICVNDGSTDRSLEILKEIAGTDERFVICTQDNAGQSAARNAGTRLAKGQYLYFMDSDDILELSALKCLVDKAERDKLDVLYFDGSSFSDSEECSEQIETFRKYYTRTGSYDGIYTGEELMSLMKKNNEYRVSPCLQLINKEFFIGNGLWFYEGIIHEDNLFNYKCMLSALRVGHVNTSYFNRRVRSGSTMTSAVSFANVYGYFRCFMEMEKFYREKYLDTYNIEALGLLLEIINSARNKYAKLSAVEKYSVDGMPPYLRTLFDVYVVSYNKISDLQERIRILEQRDIKRLKNQIQTLEKRVKELETSTTFKVGHIILWIPKKIKDAILCKVKS